MSALALLVACLLAGMAFAHWTRVPRTLIDALNFWILRIALPALVLRLIPELEWDSHLWYLVASMWIVFLGAWGCAAWAGRQWGWSRARTGAVVLAAGFGNTAFVGYPLIRALRGEGAMPFAVIADQVGCFIALSTAGVIAAHWYAGQGTRAKELALRVVLFPPFLALLAGLAVGALGEWPPLVARGLDLLGLTLTPLALFAIGLQFHSEFDRGQLGAVSVALGWKLLAAPLVVWAIGAAVGAQGELLAVSVLQAGMAPMVSTTILAHESGLDGRVANTALVAGVILSLATVPILSALI